jgi:lysophospholipase L1-like esterase
MGGVEDISIYARFFGNTVAAVVLVSIIIAVHASAQDIVGMVDQPCPAPLSPPQAFASATEAILSGRAIDPESLTKLFDSPEAKDYILKTTERAKQDWPNLCRYRGDNAALQQRPRVVFLGDSITENWLLADPSLFSREMVGRGISGQTAPQMLLRFFSDVIALRPRVVHILAGTNDVACNTGPTTMQDYKNSMMAMCELARVHHIRVMLGSIPPAAAFWWRPQITPARTIAVLNGWLKTYAVSKGIRFVDYYSVLADSEGGLKKSFSADGVHPNRDGYALMRPLALAAIRE